MKRGYVFSVGAIALFIVNLTGAVVKADAYSVISSSHSTRATTYIAHQYHRNSVHEFKHKYHKYADAGNKGRYRGRERELCHERYPTRRWQGGYLWDAEYAQCFQVKHVRRRNGHHERLLYRVPRRHCR